MPIAPSLEGGVVARNYRTTPVIRVFNGLMQALLRLGLGPRESVVLTTTGRRSGRKHSTPVHVTEHGGERWLVSPYGERGWVHNVRASGQAELRRGRRSGRVRLEEVDAATAAPVLEKYYEANPITHPYWNVTSDSTRAEFEAEAAQHPVFRVAGPAG